jgi:hypothetical protein
MIARQAVNYQNDADQQGNVNTLLNSKDQDAMDSSTKCELKSDGTKVNPECVDGTGKEKDDPNTYVTSYRKTCVVSKWGLGMEFKRSCGENLSYYQCVYVNRCCYKPTVANEPACYRPELSGDVINQAGGAYKDAADHVKSQLERNTGP